MKQREELYAKEDFTDEDGLKVSELEERFEMCIRDRIKDAPRFAYRGAHFDTSRHFFTVDEVKTYIDMMALHNMNRFHWQDVYKRQLYLCVKLRFQF